MDPGDPFARVNYGFAVIVTGRILIGTKKSGLIPEVRPKVGLMRSGGHWLSDRIVIEISRQADEIVSSGVDDD